MSKWGLTSKQRECNPWGLSADDLQPAKTVTDPIHADIYLTSLEVQLLDSPPMQRLRRVRQLGTTHLVYPGATHSRFSHSLGTLRSAQDLLDAVLNQRLGPHPARDLFEEWESQGQDEYDKMVAEATVLARLGALLHDLCQVPFGHSIEDDIGILPQHDANTRRFDMLWTQIDKDLRDRLGTRLTSSLRNLILSKAKPEVTSGTSFEALTPYPFVTDIVGNTICADLLDYLDRDHQNMGLPAKLGHRFIDGFYVTRSDSLYHAKHMALKITRNGTFRADVITELFKFLRYRYELSERGLVHHAKLAADAMIAKTLEMWYDSLTADAVINRDPSLTKNKSDIDALLVQAGKGNTSLPEKAKEEAKERIEEELVRRSDDGILEWLLDQTETDSTADARKAGIAELTKSLLHRKLYKLIGRSDQSSRSMANKVYQNYGGLDQRRRLEEKVARYAGLDHRWHVVLWIPSPDMRLKAADVLVDVDGQIMPLKEYDRNTKNRGRDIYESHEALWAVSVYVHPSVRNDKKKSGAILGWLREHMGIEWEESMKPLELTKLAAEIVAEKLNLNRSQQCSLEVQIAGFKGEDTFQSLCESMEQVVHSWQNKDESRNIESDMKDQKKLL